MRRFVAALLEGTDAALVIVDPGTQAPVRPQFVAHLADRCQSYRCRSGDIFWWRIRTISTPAFLRLKKIKWLPTWCRE